MAEIQSVLMVTLRGKNAIGIDRVEDAVAVCAKFRDEYDYGCGIGADQYYGFRTGRVFSGKKQVAQIHYNGRIELK